MAKNNIEYNLNSMVELQDTILQILRDRGDIVVPDKSCLGNVPNLIKELSNRSYVSTGVQTDIAKCGSLITRFAVFSDIHCASPFTNPDTYKDSTGYLNGTAAIKQYAYEAMNDKLDFVVFCGDLLGPEGGDADVYGALQDITDEWRSILAPTGIPLYMIGGNHDSGCDISVWHNVSGIKQYDNDVKFMDDDRTCFYKVINGDLFIWFSLFNNKRFTYSTEQFQWLFDLLDSNRDKTRVFLFSHWYDGTVDGFGWRYLNGKYINHGWHEDDDERFGKIKDYRNLIWISGHAHTDWKFEDKYPTIKVHSNNTARMVNVPSLKDNNQDVRISVYSNMVVVEPYSKNKKLASKIYYIGNGITEKVVRITYNLIGVSLSNTSSSVLEGKSYSTSLDLLPYYKDMKVKVFMGGVDITNTAFEYDPEDVEKMYSIFIPSATGDIDITATATSTVTTHNINYTLNGFTHNGLIEFVEGDPVNITLSTIDDFVINKDDITVKIGNKVFTQNDTTNGVNISFDESLNKVMISIDSKLTYNDIYIIANATKDIRITYDLVEDAIIDNKTNVIKYGDSYIANVSMADGSTPDVQVLINGIDMSSNYYKDGVINIPNVTTDITIKIQNMDSKYNDYVKMTYNVTSVSTPTQLLYPSYAAKYIAYMVIDGVEVDYTTSYTFTNTGKHTVYIKLVSQEFHSNFAKGCNELVSVTIPDAVQNYSSSMFRDCANLEKLIINCNTHEVSLSTYNIYNNPKLTKIVFGAGITGVAQNNFNSACIAINDIYIYNPTSFNWLGSRLDNQGTLHYKESADLTVVREKLPNFTFVADL